MAPPRLIYPCPPYNVVNNGFYGPPSVAGQIHHNAVDFPAPNNTNLLAPMAGLVTEVGTAGAPGYQATGNMIEVSADGFSVRMLHLRQSLVRVGQRVTQGEHIGYTDNTGLTTGPHLHMAVWADTKGLALQVQADPVQVYGRWAVDPERLLEEDDLNDLDRQMLQETWGMLRFLLGPADNEQIAEIVEAIPGGNPGVVAAEKANGAEQRKLPNLYHPTAGWMNKQF